MAQIDFTTLPQPIFIDSDPETIYQGLVASWESITTWTLPDPSPERDFFRAIAYRLQVSASWLNFTGRLQYVPWSVGDALTDLAANYGLTRLAPAPARAEFTWNFSTTAAVDGTIPAGTRIQSNDGSVNFSIDSDADYSAGDTTVSFDCTCTTTGTSGNDYAAGTVDTPIDTVGIDIVDNGTVANIETTTGGGAEETDDQLRQRITLANETYSTAGSRGAYIFWARSYSTNIVDAEAEATPGSGVATVWILEKNGTIPSAATLAAVQTYLDGDTIRPMNDTVSVEAPTQVDYTIVGTIDYYKEAAGTIDETIVEANRIVGEWADVKLNQLGGAIVPNEIVALVVDLPGVFDLNLTTPTKQILTRNEFAKLSGSVTLTKGSEIS